MALDHVSESLLQVGLSEAMLTTKEWLTPGMIEELCYGESKADRDRSEVDRAWTFITSYISKHTIDGHPVSGRVTFPEDGSPPFSGPSTPAPELSPAMVAALEAVGGTRREGLKRINEATGTEKSFIKKDFGTAYLRAERAA